MGEKTTLASTRSVFVGTFLVLCLAVAIGSLGAGVIATMRDSADMIDNQRAVRAAQAAISSVKFRLAGTVRDNAVWDEAYQAITRGDAVDWVYRNWGKTSADYPLYDGVMLTGPQGQNLAAYWKGTASDTAERLGSEFADQVTQSAAPGRDPLVSVFHIDGRPALVGSQAVQPFSTGERDSAYRVLSFVKMLTPEMLSSLAHDYQLPGLHIGPADAENPLSVPLASPSGRTVDMLSWPSEAPGTKVYAQVYPTVLGCVALLVLFITAVLFAGGAEARRLHKLAEEARFQASHDGLTGLFNRFGLFEELRRLMALSGSQLTLHRVDLDGFKPVNDAWGHKVGDALLARAATGLKESHPDVVLAARIGGDEFALVQRGPAKPTDVAEQVLAIFSRPFHIEGRTIEVGASIGIAGRDDATEPQELLRRADMALYAGKAVGRGRLMLYDRQLDAEREQVTRMEGDLRQALADNQIAVLFQPLISASTREIRGVEALARWEGRRQTIGPDVFVPLAEKSGLIDELGMQMLRKAMHTLKTWPDLVVSVNVSPIQLCNPAFAGDVLAALKDEEFDPARLVLEITEGVLMSNPDQAKRAIDALRLAGIRFALDDFGSGYASIGALRQFGFDRMKIDRSLVEAADRDKTGLDLLKATIALAAALGVPVTAEGVETGRQADMLQTAGCDLLQGYLVGRPMSAQELKSRFWISPWVA